jgi:hypothetical protein
VMCLCVCVVCVVCVCMCVSVCVCMCVRVCVLGVSDILGNTEGLILVWGLQRQGDTETTQEKKDWKTCLDRQGWHFNWAPEYRLFFKTGFLCVALADLELAL